MKLKLKLDKDSLQQFFLDHAEKIVFGTAVVIGLLLISSAIGRGGFDKSPKELATSAANAVNIIQKTKPKPNDLTAPDFLEIARRSRTTVEDNLYVYNNYWDQPLSMGGGKRGTPDYLPITELQARDGRGALSKRRGQSVGERWILVWGVVPLGKQAAEYRKAFENAKSQNPATDSPIYLAPVVERAEITYTDEAPKWEIVDLAKQKTKLDSFSSSPAEMIDASLRPETLAWSLPPRSDGKSWGDSIYPESLVGPPYRLVKEDPERYRGKPVIWMADSDRTEGKCVIYKRRSERAVTRDFDYFAVEFADADTAEQNLKLSLVKAVVEGSMAITVDERGQRQLRKTVPLLKVEGTNRDDASADGPARPDRGPARGPAGPARGPAGPARGPAGGPAGDASETALSGQDNVLFRVIDFDVQPGKSYRYRVSLVLKNPNFGVESRYLMKPDEAKNARMTTAPVAMTESVTVPRDVRLLAKSARSSSRIDSEPSGEMMVVDWLRSNGIEAFKEFRAFRGIVPDFPNCKFPEEKKADNSNDPLAPARPAANTDSIPVDYVTGATVLDIRGGEKMPGNRDQKTTEPAEFLVLTAEGNLEVANEINDAAEIDYRLNGSSEDMRPAAAGPAFRPEGGGPGPVGPGPVGPGPRGPGRGRPGGGDRGGLEGFE